jgi:hypothetical protein
MIRLAHEVYGFGQKSALELNLAALLQANGL